jgi:hypothetical protein
MYEVYVESPEFKEFLLAFSNLAQTFIFTFYHFFSRYLSHYV